MSGRSSHPGVSGHRWSVADGRARSLRERVRRRAALGRIHRVEQARLLREAAALLLASPAASVMGGLLTRLLRMDRRLDRRGGGDGRWSAFLDIDSCLPVLGGPDRERWRRRARAALALARADRFAAEELALAVVRPGLEGGAAGRTLVRARGLLDAAGRLDPDPELDALLAVLEFLEGNPDRGEARARLALGSATLLLAADPDRLRGSLELLRALAREERGRPVASLPALERARRAANAAERAGIDACALSIALGVGELHVGRVAAVRLASIERGLVPGVVDLVTRRAERRAGWTGIAPCARRLAGRLLSSRNAPAAAVVLASLRASGRVTARRGGEATA